MMVTDFGKYGIKSNGILHVSPKETVELCNAGAVLVDVREEYLNGFKKFGVPRVIYMPKSTLKERFRELPEGRVLIVADSAGLRSRETVEFLLQHGFTKIANLAGGLVEWERDHMPLNTDIREQLTGSCMCQLKPRNRKKKSPK